MEAVLKTLMNQFLPVANREEEVTRVYEVEFVSVCPLLLNVINLEPAVWGKPVIDQFKFKSLIRVLENTILVGLELDLHQAHLRKETCPQYLLPICLVRNH